ncbi:MAG: ATP-binding cassette domain-containing protein, partial [Nocardioidaceae bacterium]
AASALIEDEPEPRDRLELQRFATQRLGKDVIDIEDASLVRGSKQLLSHATWRLGPGDRVGLVGVNGAGKTSVLRLVAGELEPDSGRVKRGRTVALEHLSQVLDHLDPRQRVLDSVEGIKRVTRTTSGEITASSMLERFGFTGDRLTARIGDLSGGERRRLQMLRLLLTEPNVLLLDEPTNDLDIETLTVLEDFLDGWPGTLVVVSHDRYFLERVTDSTWAMLGDGQIAMLPRGVEEYLERRAESLRTSPADTSHAEAGAPVPQPTASAGELRDARKVVQRLERQLARLADRQTALHAQLAEHAADYERLAALDIELRELVAQRDALEGEWLEAAALLD